MQTKRRFNVLKCGRRFGKTSIAKELIIEPALDGFPVAYFCPTYKDLNDFWIDIVKILGDAIKQKNEQLKQIRLITGGVIDMWSLDEPDSGRGRRDMARMEIYNIRQPIYGCSRDRFSKGNT
jgi:hypothetical protein